MPTKRYFTLNEANAEVPGLQALFTAVMQVRSQLKLVYERLELAGFAPSDDDADEPDCKYRAHDRLRESALHFKARADLPGRWIAKGDSSQPGSAQGFPCKIGHG